MLGEFSFLKNFDFIRNLMIFSERQDRLKAKKLPS